MKCTFFRYFVDFFYFSLFVKTFFQKLVVPNRSTMKNIKRIVLLITIVAIAQKVLFSDFQFTKQESASTETMASNSF